MGRNRRNWAPELLSKAEILGVKITFDESDLWAESRVHVKCEHREFSTNAHQFLKKVCCCRTAGRLGKKASPKTLEKLNELVLRRSWCHKEPRDGDNPDFFYVTRTRGFTKVGRCRDAKYLSQYDEVVYLRDDLLLKHTVLLERKVRERFDSYRVLDRSMGLGWTEIYDLSPITIIDFVEGVL
jgi:hypothetical protein